MHESTTMSFESDENDVDYCAYNDIERGDDDYHRRAATGQLEYFNGIIIQQAVVVVDDIILLAIANKAFASCAPL